MKMKLKNTLVAVAAALAMSVALAQVDQSGSTCQTADTVGGPMGPCTIQKQQLGDVLTTTTNGDVDSKAVSIGNSTASEVSGNNVNFDNRTQASQTAAQNTDATITTDISGGNTESNAQGGNATGGNSKGNTTTVDNKSSVGPVSNGANTNGPNSNGANSNGANSNGANTNGANTGSLAIDAAGGNATGGQGGMGGLGGKGGQGGTGGAVGNTTAGANSTGGTVGDTAAVSGAQATGGAVGPISNNLAAQGGKAGDSKAVSKQSQALKDAGNSTVSTANTSNTSLGVSNDTNVKNDVKTGDNAGRASNQSKTATSNDGSGNATTKLDLSNNGVDNRVTKISTVFIPAIVPPTPPSINGVSGIIKDISVCGPLMRVTNSQVLGVFHGFTGRDYDHQGYNQELAPYIGEDGRVVMYHHEPLPDGSGYTRYGHQVVETTALIGTAGARNLSLGGGGGQNSNWAQGGGGSTSNAQQLITTIRLRLCEKDVAKYVVKVVEVEPAPRVQYIEMASPRKDRN